MGEVPAFKPPEPEKPPGVPEWAPWVPPRWLPRAAIAAAALVVIVTLGFWLGHRPRRGGIIVATPPPPPAVTAAQPPKPAEPPPAPEPEAKAEPAPEKKPKAPAPPKPSAYAKDFERAQKALWTGQAASAESILGPILKNPKLSKKDKARGSKLMADAQLKKGNKFGAIDWYKRALRVTDDAAEKDKLQKALAAIK
jgi:outer membrane biosynthesis protein TonB